MKVVVVHESREFESGIDLGDLISGLPDGAEEIKLMVEEGKIVCYYCLRVMKRERSKR